MGQMLRLDFGTSLKYEGKSVNEIISRSLPVSASVGILAYLLALIVGITIGSIAALKQNSRWDYSSMALAMLGICVPNFVLGPILVLCFSLTLYCLPPSRWGGFPTKHRVLGHLHCLHRASYTCRHVGSAALRLHSHCASKRLE